MKYLNFSVSNGARRKSEKSGDHKSKDYIESPRRFTTRWVALKRPPPPEKHVLHWLICNDFLLVSPAPDWFRVWILRTVNLPDLVTNFSLSIATLLMRPNGKKTFSFGHNGALNVIIRWRIHHRAVDHCSGTRWKETFKCFYDWKVSSHETIALGGEIHAHGLHLIGLSTTRFHWGLWRFLFWLLLPLLSGDAATNHRVKLFESTHGLRTCSALEASRSGPWDRPSCSPHCFSPRWWLALGSLDTRRCSSTPWAWKMRFASKRKAK